MFRNLPFGFGVLILAIWYVRCLFDRFTIANGRVTHSHGILSKSDTEISISSIRSVKIHQRLLQRIFRTGSVSIFTAGDKPEIVVHGLPDPHVVKQLLDQLVHA
jgi:uncharacterized membrane protein YdbT with pleckstrin-like domain